jgi:hypothetical protein
MSGTIAFPADSVRRHAGAVAAACDQMAQTQSAVREVTMDSQAYGRLCQFLPGLLSPLFGVAAGVLGDARGALDETASQLRTTADAMDVTDAGSARRVDGAGGSGLRLPL